MGRNFEKIKRECARDFIRYARESGANIPRQRLDPSGVEKNIPSKLKAFIEVGYLKPEKEYEIILVPSDEIYTAIEQTENVIGFWNGLKTFVRKNNIKIPLNQNAKDKKIFEVATGYSHLTIFLSFDSKGNKRCDVRVDNRAPYSEKITEMFLNEREQVVSELKTLIRGDGRVVFEKNKSVLRFGVKQPGKTVFDDPESHYAWYVKSLLMLKSMIDEKYGRIRPRPAVSCPT